MRSRGGPQCSGGALVLGRRSVLVFAILLWSGGVGVGLWGLWTYAATAGTPAAAPQRWPADSTIARSPGQPALVVFAHPQCPCSRATIGELARLMTHAQGGVTASVLFLKPPGVDDAWVKSDLWRSAAVIPGVEVREDQGGLEAWRFGAATSGQTLLYDERGRLVFHGGITAGRGHFGDNAGRIGLVRYLTEDVAPSGKTPVFGCALHDPEAVCAKEGSHVCPKR